MKPRAHKEWREKIRQSEDEPRSETSRMIYRCRSAFYFSKVREAHNAVIKHLPHELTDLVCEYLLNLNRCNIEILKKLAHSSDQNDPLVIDAQARLGDTYYRGIDVRKDTAEGIKWFRLARKREDLSAGAWALGECCYYGIDMNKNIEAAVIYHKKAAAKGYAPAQTSLATCYRTSRGVARDYKEAMRLYGLAAVQGYARAQYILGWCYRLGEGVCKNPKKVFSSYSLAAAQGHILAQSCLASCYEYGEGIAKSREKAIELYLLAAKQGDGNAQRSLKRLGVSVTKSTIESVKESGKESEKVQEKEAEKTKEPGSPSLSR